MSVEKGDIRVQAKILSGIDAEAQMYFVCLSSFVSGLKNPSG
jgi:hypothetical protein